MFGLVPALPLFRLHQWVAYGGTFGEYYAYGPTAYLLGLAVYWATCCVYLVLYAAVLRAGAEPFVRRGASLPAAAVSPAVVAVGASETTASAVRLAA